MGGVKQRSITEVATVCGHKDPVAALPIVKRLVSHDLSRSLHRQGDTRPAAVSPILHRIGHASLRPPHVQGKVLALQPPLKCGNRRLHRLCRHPVRSFVQKERMGKLKSEEAGSIAPVIVSVLPRRSYADLR